MNRKIEHPVDRALRICPSCQHVFPTERAMHEHRMNEHGVLLTWAQWLRGFERDEIIDAAEGANLDTTEPDPRDIVGLALVAAAFVLPVQPYIWTFVYLIAATAFVTWCVVEDQCS